MTHIHLAYIKYSVYAEWACVKSKQQKSKEREQRIKHKKQREKLVQLRAETELMVAYEGMCIKTTHGSVVEAIRLFEEMSEAKRKEVYLSVQVALEKAKQFNPIPETMRLLCDDLLLVLAAEKVMLGKQIPIVKDPNKIDFTKYK